MRIGQLEDNEEEREYTKNSETPESYICAEGFDELSEESRQKEAHEPAK